MLAVFLIAALLAASVCAWMLCAYRRAGDGARPAPALLACAFVALGALGLYAATGRPELPDAPYAARLAALKHKDPATYTLDEALAVLGEAAKGNPRDPAPRLFTGQLLLDRGDAQAAASAFDAALRRDPNSSEAKMGLARALVRSNDGRVTPDALRLFQSVAATSPDPAPWIYQAMAAMQDGNEAEARRFWGEALQRMPADDPRREMAQRMSRGG